jgi:hypothetical protein
MSYGVSTSVATQTHTVTDIRKAFEGFEADLRMIRRRTEAQSEQWAENVGHDVHVLAEEGYLSQINVIFYDCTNRKRFARRYTPETGTFGTTDRPGANPVPTDPLGRLDVVISYSSKWYALSDEQRRRVRASLRISWGPSQEDITHADMRSTGGRRYASNGFSLARSDFESYT